MRWLPVLAVAVSLGACGGSSESPEDERAVARTVDGYFEALADADGDRACDYMTKEAAEARAEAGGEACAPAVEAEAEKLLDGQRDALRGISAASVEITDDEAQVELRLEDDTFARLSGRPLKVVRDGERWLIERTPDAPSPKQQSGKRRGTALDCRTGGLENYENGQAAKLWEDESREDFIAFITRYCDRVAKEVADLSDRRELERIATEVLRSMVRSGRIDPE